MNAVISTHLLTVNAIVLFLFMTAWFFVSKQRKRIDSVDIAWGLGFVLVAWLVELQRPSSRNLLIAALVSVWGIRLARHIRSRSKTRGEDRRYTELSSKWKHGFWIRAYISIFITQGLLILIISTPITVATNPKFSSISLLSYVGFILWCIGFVIEVISDKQLARYLRKEHRPKVMKTGLWEYSRHPNYFGELMQWWAIGIIALQVSYGWVGLFGPLVLSLLIIYVSGIPPIERHRVLDPEYKKYQEQTSMLIPRPPKTT